ncbi:MAG: HAD-IB family phosphatase [Rickettsiales bacterium]|jgi:HAD superfamily phosphoserine phosphatase-like hydrolase|nr:HAD-IB family phosphatase [Rickettsiales bacterium]
MLSKFDVVVFDFDGTLSAKDANMMFGKYCFAHSARPWLFLPLIGVALVAKMLNRRGVWWRQKMRGFLTAEMVEKFAPGFIKQHKLERFGWSKEQVAAERKKGRKVLLISAGPDYLIPELVKDIKFDAVICSKMNPLRPWEYEFFCWGANKVVGMDEWAKKNKILPNLARAYSDSKSDLPIMSLAKEQIWINPKTGGIR